MKVRFALVVAVLSFCVLPLSEASSFDLANDPEWQSLMSEPSWKSVEGAKSCTGTANCGTSTLNCTGGDGQTCTGKDRNCSIGQRGYVKCGSTTTYCPGLCTIINPNPTNRCTDNPTLGCYYTWSPQDLCCYTSNANCSDYCL